MTKALKKLMRWVLGTQDLNKYEFINTACDLIGYIMAVAFINCLIAWVLMGMFWMTEQVFPLTICLNIAQTWVLLMWVWVAKQVIDWVITFK